jgi:hypothetical protein
MGCCVSQLEYTTCQWMGCYVCQVAYTTSHWHTKHATWHTQHPTHWPIVYANWDTVYANWHVVYANGLLCMPIGIHNIPSIGTPLTHFVVNCWRLLLEPFNRRSLLGAFLVSILGTLSFLVILLAVFFKDYCDHSRFYIN